MKNKKLMIMGHWLVLLCMFGIVAFVFQQIATSFTEQGVASGDALYNAALFPRYIAITIAVLGLIVAGQMLFKGIPEEEESFQVPVEIPEKKSHLVAKEIVVVILTLLYLVLLEPLGFLLTTFILISAMFYVLDARPLYKVLLASALLTFLCSFIFEGLLKVILPLGFLNFGIPYHFLGL